jgi:hypothetical protein
VKVIAPSAPNRVKVIAPSAPKPCEGDRAFGAQPPRRRSDEKERKNRALFLVSRS